MVFGLSLQDVVVHAVSTPRDEVGAETGIADGRAAEANVFASQPQAGKRDEGFIGVSAAAAGSETVAQLQQLAALHASGALTDAQFAAAKTGLLS